MMNNGTTKFAFLVVGFAAVCSAALPAPVSASGFYIGGDVVIRMTDVDYNYGPDPFITNHLRAKGGYEFMKNLAGEVHVMTAGSDSQGNFPANTYEFDTGTIIGVYAKPKTSFSKANVYGLLGIALWDTSYTHVISGTKYADDAVLVGLGVGGEFNVTRNLRLHVEGMVQTGSADYGIGFSADLISSNLAFGLTYQF